MAVEGSFSTSKALWVRGRCPGAVGFLLLAAAALAGSATPASAAGSRNGAAKGKPPPQPTCGKSSDFVQRHGSELRLGRDTFRFAGSNNYYLGYSSQFMVDDVLGRAANAGFTAMRTWGAFDAGDPADTSTWVDNFSDKGVYYQYWDSVASAPAFNDGDNGLKHLDYVISRASALGLRLVIPFVNNWDEFGGMDQYVRWAGANFHDDFYTNSKIRAWYKKWAEHLLNHVNGYTGVKLKDDPTIMAWELANEPRCQSYGVYPRSNACTSKTLTKWAGEMSRFIKGIDKKHLLSAGDEGFYCDGDAGEWTENCTDGVDTLALGRLPEIDMLSFHLYPDNWSKDVSFGQGWIEGHFADALALGKPAYLGEFGLKDQATRNTYFKLWTDTIFDVGGAGGTYWMLSGLRDNGTLYPDYDGFTVYCPSPVCTTVSHHAAMMTVDKALEFAPVADNDPLTVPFPAPPVLVLHPVDNDVSYGDASIVPSSLDLDPLTAGQQSFLVLDEGTLEADANGSVAFMPAAGFTGTLEVRYVVSDTRGRTSNPATLAIELKPDPNGALLLHSFESGTEGFAPLNTPDAVTLELSSAFATQGAQSLRIIPNPDLAGGDWVGRTYAGAPLDISSKTRFSWDVHTEESGYSIILAIQSGSDWTWCEAGDWGWVNGGTDTTIQVDFSSFCAEFDPTQIQSFYIYAGNNGPGAVSIDNIRAE